MYEASDSKDIGIDVVEKGNDRLYKSASDKAPPETIYSMYLKKADEEDRRTAQGWKDEAEKVFLFVSV
jgi:hypothetical protein